MPLLRALRIREPRMQDGNFIAEHLMQIRRDSRSQPNFWNEQDRRPSLIEDLAHAGQVHGRLSGSGDAMQQQAGEFTRGYGLSDLAERFFLRCAELELKG